jgi:phosphatidylserine/phosphatidylglycerophosphate/cardiolipin synthase-like enzyme
MKALTKDLPPGANIQVWVGAWRHGASWNHAKLIAVDGRYLHTGGHNVWSDIYIMDDPVHDLSLEMEGSVGHDAHMYANGQWDYIQNKQSSWIGQIAENIPDFIPLVAKSRVIVSEYPRGKASEFPPAYNPSLAPTYETPPGSVPVISVGRQGAMIANDRPADDALIAMIDASKTIIRMSQQDIGPICIPGTKIPLPGVSWPKPVLDALARAIWLRGVDVEIVLSNFGSRRGYTNGWTCVDVGSEIIKRIEKQFQNTLDSELRKKVEENLRICYIRHKKTDAYQSGEKIGNHTKFFMVDDVTSYTGSQNLYVSDLAEWGVIIDSAARTKEMMEDYWNPMWNASYLDTDCDVQEVMDGLKIDRDGEETSDGRKLEEAGVAMAATKLPPRTEMYDKE